MRYATAISVWLQFNKYLLTPENDLRSWNYVFTYAIQA